MSNITLASWNVNSLKVRLPQLLDWLKTSGVDAVVLQETKLTDDVFPAESIREAGYDVVFTGQKTYNGVALLSKRDVFLPPEDVLLGLPDFPDDHKRFVAATLVTRREGKAIRFIGGYFPNGMAPGSWKYLYKLDWIAALTRHLKDTLTQCPDLVLGGDFNIAPEDADVWNPAERKDDILVSGGEAAFFSYTKTCTLLLLLLSSLTGIPAGNEFHHSSHKHPLHVHNIPMHCGMYNFPSGNYGLH